MNEETLFLEALALPADQRAKFLDQACAGRPELKAAVEALLAAHEKSGHLLDRPPGSYAETTDSTQPRSTGAADSDAPSAARTVTVGSKFRREDLEPTQESGQGPDQPPTDPARTRTFELSSSIPPGLVIAGRYELLEKIGEGGMGEVWVARQSEPVKRKVALKLIKPGMDSRAVLQRFEQERQALAVMDHPNIARVLDGGLTSDTSPRERGLAPRSDHDSPPRERGLAPRSSEVPVPFPDLPSPDPTDSSPRERGLAPRSSEVPVPFPDPRSPEVPVPFPDPRSSEVPVPFPDPRNTPDPRATPGRPFFVMELVNGLPLTKFCDEARLTPRERLELFVPICQAVQHAHQKGIVHRDLKPANILITLIDGRPVPKVIDFGVAKATAGKLTDESLSTQFGAVVGTLEYMSPEQAGFSGEDIDTRADIYSLGVILYELLTGLRPIDAKRLRQAALTEMIRIIREEEPSKPSTRFSTDDSAPSVAALRQTEPKKLTAMLRGDLDWVVMKCLEKPRNRRYETANALARDVQRFLDDEPVEARPPSASYRLSKFVRRNPLQLTLAGTVMLLLLGGASVVWWQSNEAGARRATELRRQLEDEQRAAADSARLARNAEAVAALLGQAEEALKADDAAKAAIVLEAARKRTAEGGAGKETKRLGQLDADLALLRDLDAVDQFRWTPVENRNKVPDAAVVASRTQEALNQFGVDPDAVSVADAATRVAASLVRGRIIPALDRLLQIQQKAEVRAVLRRLDADPYRDAVRDAVLANDWMKMVELAKQDDALEQPPGFVAFLGANPAIEVVRRRQLLQAALNRQPGNLGLLMTLGGTYQANQKEGVDEELRWYQAAIAASPSNAAAHTHLGTALNDKGQSDEAITWHRKAIALDPKYTAAHNNLGVALYGKRQLDEAIVCWRKAIALDPYYAMAHNNLGVALKDKGRVDEAIACHKKAIALDPNYAMAHDNLGSALKDKGRVDEAIACHKKAIALDPKYAPAHNNLGVALYDKGQWDEAIACHKKAIALDPKYAPAHNNLGVVLYDKGQLDEAIVCYKKAIELDPKFAPAHNNLGITLEDKGRVDAAIACYHKAIELDPKFAPAHTNLGALLSDKSQWDEAITWHRKAIELDPKFAPAHNNLAFTSMEKGDLVGASSAIDESLRLDPENAIARATLAEILLIGGRFAEAVPALERAVERLRLTNPGMAPTYAGLLPRVRWLAEQVQKVHALRKPEAGGANEPTALERAERARAEGRPALAARIAEVVFAVSPTRANDVRKGYRYNAACAAALAASGQGKNEPTLDDQAKTKLRAQALVWLQAELATCTKLLDSANEAQKTAIAQTLAHWQTDPDLASLRGDAINSLPEPARAPWRTLWDQVEALRLQAAGQAKQDTAPPADPPPAPELPANPFAR